MEREWTARSYSSGDEVELRFSAGGAIAPDRDWVLVERDGVLILSERDRANRFPVERIWGIGSDLGLKFIRSEDRIFEPRPSESEDVVSAEKAGVIGQTGD